MTHWNSIVAIKCATMLDITKDFEGDHESFDVPAKHVNSRLFSRDDEQLKR